MQSRQIAQGACHCRRPSGVIAPPCTRVAAGRLAAPVLASSVLEKPSAAQEQVGQPQMYQPQHYASVVEGSLLGAMCGNILGAPLQDDRCYQIVKQRPAGVQDFWPYDLHQQRMPYGTYTGEFAGLLAVARSLVSKQHASADSLLEQLVAAYNRGAPLRRFNKYDARSLELAQAVSNPGVISFLLEQQLEQENGRNGGSASDRAEHEPYGPQDFNAAARAAPLGLAYRHAPLDQLVQANRELCAYTHARPLALDSSVVLSAAVAWLSRQPQAASVCGPDVLLEYLASEVAATPDMRAKLQLLRKSLIQVGPICSWQQHFRSREWHVQTQLLNRITYHSYATTGSEAVAVALWALACNWQQPEQTVITAATFGGNAPAVAQMAGALAGALHGSGWLPGHWLSNAEDGEDGVSGVQRVAEQLAGLDLRMAGPGSAAVADAAAQN